MANILIYGDSNTHGTMPLEVLGGFARYAEGARWPDVMAARLGAGYLVVAEGLPGRTTVHDDVVEGGNRNGLTVLPAVLLSHVPLDLLVVMLGTNDLKSRFSVSAFEIARSVERLVVTARGLVPGAAVLVVAPAPVRQAGVLADVFAGAEARQQGLEAYLEAACGRTGAMFLRAGDHVAVSPVDGVHWEAEAHGIFGEVMAGVVAALLPVARAFAKPAGALPAPDPSAPKPPVTLDRVVPEAWSDYNGHMNEAFYLTAFSEATDQLLDWAGMDADCIAQGYSIFTVETHIRNLAEVNIGDRIVVTTRVIAGGDKKFHVWQELRVDGQLCATSEQLLLHMDLNTRRSAPPRADVAAWLGAAAAAHGGLPMPEGLGRSVGQRD